MQLCNPFSGAPLFLFLLEDLGFSFIETVCRLPPVYSRVFEQLQAIATPYLFLFFYSARRQVFQIINMTGRLTRPPFIDPTTGIAYDASNSEFEGYLTKQSMWLRVSNIIAVVLCAHDDDTSAHDDDDTRFIFCI